MSKLKWLGIIFALFFSFPIFTNNGATDQTQQFKNQVELDDYVKKFVKFVDDKCVKYENSKLFIYLKSNDLMIFFRAICMVHLLIFGTALAFDHNQDNKFIGALMLILSAFLAHIVIKSLTIKNAGPHIVMDKNGLYMNNKKVLKWHEVDEILVNTLFIQDGFVHQEKKKLRLIDNYGNDLFSINCDENFPITAEQLSALLKHYCNLLSTETTN